MGKKVGKNRRRHARENATADAIMDGKAAGAAEERALGMDVSTAPDDALFTVDRTPVAKDAFEQRMRWERKAAPKARRAALRSEAAANDSKVKPVVAHIPGQKKAPPPGTLEKRLLEKRTFKKRAKAPRTALYSRDLWQEAAPKSAGRMAVEKCNKDVRAARVLLRPGDGDSVNPAFEAHQNALGEAVADLMAKKADNDVARKRNAVDFSKLPAEKDDEGDIAMDDHEEQQDDDSDEEQVAAKKVAPERKSRTERNKEKRRKHALSNRSRNIAKRAHNAGYERIEDIARVAIAEAEKLNRTKAADEVDAIAPRMKAVAKEAVRTERVLSTVPLAEDLTPQLRGVAMNTSCTAMTERYLSMERRGLVEPAAVLRREAKQAANERRAALLRDKPRRNRRHSRSKISYWRQGGKKK